MFPGPRHPGYVDPRVAPDSPGWLVPAVSAPARLWLGAALLRAQEQRQGRHGQLEQQRQRDGQDSHQRGGAHAGDVREGEQSRMILWFISEK